MPPTPRARRTRLSPAVIAFRLALYILVTWGTLELLASGLFPGAQWVTLALALYTTIPIAAFALWRGWPFYPNAAFRLLVVRPFWYTQLLLPLVSAAGLLGLILGAPFGASLLVGRILAGAMLGVAAVLPCFRVYAEVGAAIAGAAAPDHPYAAWIATYSDPAFAAITGEVEALADRLAKRAGAGVPERMDAAYALSTRLEWMFWDSAWRGERWPDV